MSSECEMYAGYWMLDHRHEALSIVVALFLFTIVYGVWPPAAHCLPGSKAGMPVPVQSQQVIITTVDGVKIRALEMATGRDAMLIYCHRLLSSKESFDPIGFGSVFLHEFDVLALDFRGHSWSGRVSNCGGDEVLDLRAAIQYARSTGCRKIILLGVGMGGVVAIREAALFGNADAVVAVSPCGQPEKLKPWWWNLATDISLTTDYGKIPIRILNSTRISGRYWTGSPIYLVDRVSPAPLLIVHGQGDRYLNREQVQRLYDDAREPKKLLILPQSKHAEGLLDESTSELIITWVKEVLPKQSPEIPHNPPDKGRFLRKACYRFCLPPLEKGNNPLTPPLKRGMGGFESDSGVKGACSENPPYSPFTKGDFEKSTLTSLSPPLGKRENSAGSDTDSSSQSSVPIKDIDIHGDIVLPEKMIKSAVKVSADGASDSHEQLARIKKEVEALHRARGYTLSQVSEIQLSADGRLSLGIEVGKIDRIAIDGNHYVPSEQIQQVLQIAEGRSYNAWEIETAVKRLDEFPVFANVENQLKQDADGNTVKILVKERRPWSLGVTSHFTDFDKFGGIQFSVNELRSGAWRGFSELLLGLQHRRPLYQVNIEKGWFRQEALSIGFGFERFIYSWDNLDYYFARQEARRQGADVNAAYKITDSATVHLGLYRKRFSVLDWEAALPVDNGFINALTLRLENQGRFLRRGAFFNWRSQTFMETATTRARGDYGYTAFQFNVYPQLILSPTQSLNLGLHWGHSGGDVPQQKLFSLGGDATLPGYDDDAFIGKRVFLLRARYDLKWGGWLRENSRLAPLGVSLLFDVGDARMKGEPLKFDAPKLELGIELNYASLIRLGIVKSLGRERTALHLYFGWHPHLIRPRL